MISTREKLFLNTLIFGWEQIQDFWSYCQLRIWRVYVSASGQGCHVQAYHFSTGFLVFANSQTTEMDEWERKKKKLVCFSFSVFFLLFLPILYVLECLLLYFLCVFVCFSLIGLKEIWTKIRKKELPVWLSWANKSSVQEAKTKKEEKKKNLEVILAKRKHTTKQTSFFLYDLIR